MRTTALRPGQCDVWWARPDDRAESMLSLLDDGEKRRLERFKRSDDADRFVVAAVLARSVVASYLGCGPAEIILDRRCSDCGAPHGKPRVRGSGLELSIAHSGWDVGVAVSLGPIGLDVERLECGALHPDGMAAHALSARERTSLEQLSATARPIAWLKYWTRKEAVLKATGDGLRIDPASLAVSAPWESPRVTAWPPSLAGATRAALVDLRPGPASVACVAVLGASRLRVSERDGSRLLGSLVTQLRV
jgi:4'-phosphopantetheinyl transferase